MANDPMNFADSDIVLKAFREVQSKYNTFSKIQSR